MVEKSQLAATQLNQEDVEFAREYTGVLQKPADVLLEGEKLKGAKEAPAAAATGLDFKIENAQRANKYFGMQPEDDKHILHDKSLYKYQLQSSTASESGASKQPAQAEESGLTGMLHHAKEFVQEKAHQMAHTLHLDQQKQEDIATKKKPVAKAEEKKEGAGAAEGEGEGLLSKIGHGITSVLSTAAEAIADVVAPSSEATTPVQDAKK